MARTLRFTILILSGLLLAVALAGCGLDNDNRRSTAAPETETPQTPPAESDDAALSSLSVSAGDLDPPFATDTFEYAVAAASDVDSTTVTATSRDDAAAITIAGGAAVSGEPSEPITLETGDNVIDVVVTAEDGTTTATYTVTVTRAAPPQVSSVPVLVLDDRGQLVTGATLSVDDSDATAATGADGRGHIAIEHERRHLLRIEADGHLPQVRPVTLTGDGVPSLLTVGIARRESPVQIADVENGGTAVGRDGVRVTLPPGALVDGNGQPVTGTVDVVMTPVNVADERSLRAFPGGFEAIDAGGAEGFMLSFGTVDFRFEQSGEPLSLADGQTAMLELPLYVGADEGGVALAEGQSIALWFLDESESRWLEEAQGTVVASAASPTGLALRGEVTHFSWWNADKFARPGIIGLRVNGSGVGLAEGALPDSGLGFGCKTSDDSGPRYAGASARVGSTANQLVVPAGRDLDCEVETDGTYAADTVPDPVNADTVDVLEVEVILKPLHESGDRFIPGQRLRGEMIEVGEVHDYQFEGVAGEIFRVVAYPAETGVSPPELTGNLGASVTVLDGDQELGSANFESTIAGEVEVTLPASGEFEVRVEAQGKVPGWYVATTSIRSPSISGVDGRLAYLGFRPGFPRPARLFANGSSPTDHVELTPDFPDVSAVEGVRHSIPTSASARDLPYYQEVVPGRIIYLADHDVADNHELYMLELDNPGVAVKLSGADGQQVADFKVSPADPTRIVYWAGGEDSGRELWLADTDDPGNPVRIGEPDPADDADYDGRQNDFLFAGDGNAIVYQAGSTVTGSTTDGALYLVHLDTPDTAVRLSAPLDTTTEPPERLSSFVRNGAVSPDGRLVAYRATMSDANNVVFLANIESPGNAFRLDDSGDGFVNADIRALAFTADSRHLLTVAEPFSRAGPMHMIDVTDPANPGPAIELADSVANVPIVDPENRFVLWSVSGGLNRVDLSNPGTVMREWSYPAGGNLRILRFTPDGSALIAVIQEPNFAPTQGYLHEFGAGEFSDTRLGPRPETFADGASGLFHLELAEDGRTIYYMVDQDGSGPVTIQSTTLDDPDGDRSIIVERSDDVSIDRNNTFRLPTFLILEPGQNPGE